MRIVSVIVVAIMPSAAFGQQMAAKPTATLTLYKTADSAACSGDVAVWLDPETRVYYLKGDKFFGKTKHGGYNCRKQAEAAGYHAFKSR